jgi:hypothetical protein
MAKTLVGAEVGNSWLYLFPPALVHIFAAMEVNTLGATAASWLSTMKRSSRRVEELQGILLELQRLALHAEQSGKPMFMWGAV